jgi:hypothetical protein
MRSSPVSKALHQSICKIGEGVRNRVAVPAAVRREFSAAAAQTDVLEKVAHQAPVDVAK